MIFLRTLGMASISSNRLGLFFAEEPGTGANNVKTF
jgi:hypothetical protein